MPITISWLYYDQPKDSYVNEVLMEEDGAWKLSTGLVTLKGLCWLGIEIP